MNEKRFKVCIDNDNGVGLLDNSVKLLFIKFSNKEDAVSCKDSLKYQCNLMNELYDENEQLKEENKKLRLIISKLDEDNTIHILENRQYEKDIFDLHKKFDELEKENSQLKNINNRIDEELIDEEILTNMECLLLLIPFGILFVLLTMIIIGFLVQLGWIVI